MIEIIYAQRNRELNRVTDLYLQGLLTTQNYSDIRAEIYRLAENALRETIQLRRTVPQEAR